MPRDLLAGLEDRLPLQLGQIPPDPAADLLPRKERDDEGEDA